MRDAPPAVSRSASTDPRIGHAELIQELILNRSWQHRLKILLGPSTYRPPVAVNYMTREG